MPINFLGIVNDKRSNKNVVRQVAHQLKGLPHKKHILEKVREYYNNNMLLLRTNDGQTVFNSSELVNTINDNTNLSTLVAEVNSYMSNLGPGFSATYIGTKMSPVAWYVPAWVIPKKTHCVVKKERYIMAFVLNSNSLRVHSGTIFDGNTNARIAHAGSINSNIRGDNSFNILSQHPQKFDKEDFNKVDTSQEFTSVPSEEDSFYSETLLQQNVGNLINVYNPLIRSGKDEKIVCKRISKFLSQINDIKEQYECKLSNDVHEGIKYVNTNLKSGVETEIVISSRLSKIGKLLADDILCVAVVNDTLYTTEPEETYKENMHKIYNDNIDDFLTKAKSWLDNYEMHKLKKLPVIGISGVALPPVPLDGGEGTSGLGEEWLKYSASSKLLPPLKNYNFFTIS